MGFKKVVFFSIIAGVAAAAVPASASIKVQSSGLTPVAYIRDDGAVETGSLRVLGYIRPDGRVEDGSCRTLGYVRTDGSVEDARLQRIGWIRPGGRIEDARLNPAGYVRAGTIQDRDLTVVGYYEAQSDVTAADVTVGAYLFFFTPLLFEQPAWDTVYEP
jgi:hypothetical protein